MTVRDRLLPSALLIALAVAVGCGGPKNNGEHPNGTPPAAGPGDAGEDVDVGPLIFPPANNGHIPHVQKNPAQLTDDSLVISNCTVQYEDRQQIAAEVEATVDMIAIQPKVLPKGTYLVEKRDDESVVPFEPAGRYAGVAVEQGVPKKNGAPLPQLQQDGLIYERRPDGSVKLIPGAIFPRGAFIVERRADGSFLPYSRGMTSAPQKGEDGSVTALAVDKQGVPFWETKDKDGNVTVRTPLEKWPGNSLVGETRPDGSFVPAALPGGFPNLQLHPRDGGERVLYVKISDGEIVERGDVICYLDDQMVTARMEAATRTAAAAKEVQKSARGGVDLTKKKLDISLDLYKKGTLGYSELLQDQVTLTRFEENLAQAAQTIAKAESDFKEAAVLMRKHMVTSRVNGVVRNVVKRPGEFVKSGEKIMDIQSTEKVRLEGNLEAEHAHRLTRGMTVQVEPAIPSAPVKTHGWHRTTVTGVVVTPHPDRPLVVTVSTDRSALVWDPNLKDEKGQLAGAVALPHPAEVRSVACGPLTSQKSVVVLTGSDDGKVRLWDLGASEPGKPLSLPKAPKLVPEDAHTSAVGAVAFSADGKYFASAAGREVFVWDTDSGKKRYALPVEHQDTVTCLQFTPQAHLVTASKDRTVKLWKLGTDKAAVIKTLDHRSGAVDVLGVSKTGDRMLFDQDKTRIDVVGLSDKQTIGQIQTPGSSAAFATLAVFNPREDLILTAGGEGESKGALQVWTVPPPGGRGSEIARLITPGRVGVTCGGFSPAEKHPFLVVGTERGTVHVWTPPAASQKKYQGHVTNIDSTDPRYVTVRVEMDNRELKLLDRSTATVIVPGK
jgi:WD40 repeat protein/biotin carboxyl carrier protein